MALVNTSRATRYHVEVQRGEDGSRDMIQVNSRRPDAIKRAAFVAQDVQGWPSVTKTFVRDTFANQDIFTSEAR